MLATANFLACAPSCTVPLSGNFLPMALTEEQIAELRAALKRCSPETIEAALRFRETGAVSEVPAVVYGIIERHLSAEEAPRLAEANDDTRLVEDLSIDSLTLLEIVLSIEETLGISIDNEELKDIRTLGAVKSFIERKVSGGGADDSEAGKTGVRHFDREAIATVLPQQAPFLFVDEASLDGETIRASYTVRGDEYFLEGHFKGNPVFPASIVFEALGQAACLWVLQSGHEALAGMNEGENGEVLFASMESAHFHRRAKPGDRLDMEARLRRLRPPLAIFDGSIKVRGERLAEIEHLVLAFGPDVMEHLAEREKADAPGSAPLPSATSAAETSSLATTNGSSAAPVSILPAP
jgi:acyl carrier protein